MAQATAHYKRKILIYLSIRSLLRLVVALYVVASGCCCHGGRGGREAGFFLGKFRLKPFTVNDLVIIVGHLLLKCFCFSGTCYAFCYYSGT